MLSSVDVSAISHRDWFQKFLLKFAKKDPTWNSHRHFLIPRFISHSNHLASYCSAMSLPRTTLANLRSPQQAVCFSPKSTFFIRSTRANARPASRRVSMRATVSFRFPCMLTDGQFVRRLPRLIRPLHAGRSTCRQ